MRNQFRKPKNVNCANSIFFKNILCKQICERSEYICLQTQYEQLWETNRKHQFNKNKVVLIYYNALRRRTGNPSPTENLPKMLGLQPADIESAPTEFVTNMRSLNNSAFRILNSEFYKTLHCTAEQISSHRSVLTCRRMCRCFHRAFRRNQMRPLLRQG